jgi:hypothetical protein
MPVKSTGNSPDKSIVAGNIVKGALKISQKRVSSRDYLAQNKSGKGEK